MKIGIVTVGRSDYGIWRFIIINLLKKKNFKCSLIVTGSHFSNKFGNTFNPGNYGKSS